MLHARCLRSFDVQSHALCRINPNHDVLGTAPHRTAPYCTTTCASTRYMFGLFCGLAPDCLCPPRLVDIPCTVTCLKDFIMQATDPFDGADVLTEGTIGVSSLGSQSSLPDTDKLELVTQETAILTPSRKVKDGVTRGFGDSPCNTAMEF